MPDRSLGKIMAATDPADVATMAMIETMRQIADNGKATNRILEAVQAEVKDVRERVIRIEANRLETEVEEVKAEVATVKREAATERGELRRRIEVLEADKNRRDGAFGLVEWASRNWPAIIGYGALVALLLREGLLL